MNSEISKTLECLKNGGIIIYPSDTIWAIGCDATNSKAIKKIFKIKKRDSSLPLICLMNDYKMLKKYVNFTEKIQDFLSLQKKTYTHNL
jgi:L-threonylcarbamoyladenylate synthase